MIDWWILLFQIPIHEFGHWIVMKSLRLNPNIKFRWFGITVGENIYWNLNVTQAYLSNIGGILAGAIVLQYFAVNQTTWLVYFLVCAIDIVNIINLLNIPKEWIKADLTLLEIAKKQIFQLESIDLNKKGD